LNSEQIQCRVKAILQKEYDEQFTVPLHSV